MKKTKVTISTFSKRPKIDIIILPFTLEAKGKFSLTSYEKQFQEEISLALKNKDFSGKFKEQVLCYSKNGKEKRLLLLGLGHERKVTVESLRKAFASAIDFCLQRKITSVSVASFKIKGISLEDLIRGALEGICLANYGFEQFKSEKTLSFIKHIHLLDVPAKIKAFADRYVLICSNVHYTRDLVNMPPDVVTPSFLVKEAKTLHPKIKTKVLNKKQLEKEGLNLILAVGKASDYPPALIIMEYKGNPKSQDKTAIVGKGVTFDTGGLDIKPLSGMWTMKGDMAGAASVLGTMKAAAQLGLKKNLIGVIGTVENSVDGKSYRPSDVIKSYLGKTVEINSTDAEGRLVLADALAYTEKKYKPSRMIDLATLTGGAVVALGHEVTALMSNDDALADSLITSGIRTYERLWRLPLVDDYMDELKSDVADLKNCGSRYASSITAALFLQAFVQKTPWAHLDIAGTAYLDKKSSYKPKNATGVAVRTLIDWLEQIGD